MLAPLYILRVASREYPEFNGLSGRTYPGQEKPRPQPIVPQRRVVDEEDKFDYVMEKARIKRYRMLKEKCHNFQKLPKITEEVNNYVTVDIH